MSVAACWMSLVVAVDCCLMFAVYWLLVVVRWATSVSVVCRLLFGDMFRCSLLVAGCVLLFAGCRCALSSVGVCLLSVVCRVVVR